MLSDRYGNNSFFSLFHARHPSFEQRMMVGSLLGCSYYHHKFKESSRGILQLTRNNDIGSLMALC